MKNANPGIITIATIYANTILLGEAEMLRTVAMFMFDNRGLRSTSSEGIGSPVMKRGTIMHALKMQIASKRYDVILKKTR